MTAATLAVIAVAVAVVAVAVAGNAKEWYERMKG